MTKDIELENLVDDIEYLKYEASSLHQVIEFVPYAEKPLNGSSILELFLTIDSAQIKIIELLNDLGSDPKISSDVIFDNIELSTKEVKEISIENVISSIVTNRTKLIEHLDKKNKTFFEVELKLQDVTFSVLELLYKMVKEERAQLKEIAGLVMIYQKERQFQREVANKPRR